MKKEQLIKLMLIIVFIGFSISATISYTLGRSQEDNTTAYLILVIFAIIFGVFAQIRLQEMQENRVYLVSIVMVFLMIIFPFTGLMTLYYLLKAPKTASFKDIDNAPEHNKTNDATKTDLDSTLKVIEQVPSIEFGEIKKIFSFIALIVVVLIISSIFLKKDDSNNKTEIVSQYDLLGLKSPISVISRTEQTVSNSYQEFLNGKTLKTNVREYLNSGGVDLSIKYPQSWTIGKGNGKNIVLKGSSPINNLTQTNFLIFVRENTENITLNDIKLKGKNPFQGNSGIEYKDGGYVLLEGQPFSWDLYYMTQTQDGIELFMQMLVYSTVIDSKFVQIQFASVSGIKGTMETDKFFERMRLKEEFLGDIKLYDAMMNSVKVEKI